MDTQEQLKLVTKELEDKTFQRNLLYNVENELTSLNTNIKECISLISQSVKGKKANEIINNLTEENKKLTKEEKIDMINNLEAEMRLAAANLDFERAMQLRDILFEMKSK